MIEICIGFLVLSVIASIFGYDQTAGVAAGLGEIILILFAALMLFEYLMPKFKINTDRKNSSIRNILK